MRTVHFEAEARVSLAEVFGELSDGELLAECARRKFLVGNNAVSGNQEAWRDFAEEFRQAIRAGDVVHTDVLLIRMLVMAGVPRLGVPRKVDA